MRTMTSVRYRFQNSPGYIDRPIITCAPFQGLLCNFVHLRLGLPVLLLVKTDLAMCQGVGGPKSMEGGCDENVFDLCRCICREAREKRVELLHMNCIYG